MTIVLDLPLREGKGTKAYDQSGYDNHGTIYGASWIREKRFKGYLNCLNNDGVDDEIVVPDSESIRLTSALTVSYWLYLTEYQEAVGVFKGWRQWGRNYNFRLVVWADGSARTGVCTPTAEISGPLFSVPLNQWNNLMLVVDGSKLESFLNLESQGWVSAIAPYDGFVGEPLRIMGDPNWGEYGKGIIKDIRLYNRALNERERFALYMQTKRKDYEWSI